MPIITNDEEGVLFDDGKTQEKCPDCNGVKIWKRGKWGTRFLGCSRYPKCKWASFRKKTEPQGLSAALAIGAVTKLETPATSSETFPGPKQLSHKEPAAEFPEKQTDA